MQLNEHSLVVKSVKLVKVATPIEAAANSTWRETALPSACPYKHRHDHIRSDHTPAAIGSDPVDCSSLVGRDI
jgi:hypothetical protein